MPVVSVVRVNNNELSDYTQFLPTLSLLVWQPTLNLHWLDLSYNKLTSIDSVCTTLHRTALLCVGSRCALALALALAALRLALRLICALRFVCCVLGWRRVWQS